MLRDGLRIWNILKKIQLRYNHGVEKLGSDQAFEDFRLDHEGRQLSFCHWGREWSSTVAAAVKFFGSRPAKMNRDLKQHGMCRTLEVLLASYDYERLLRIVSLLVLKNRSQKLIKPFVPEQSSLVPKFVFEYVLCICICICTAGLIL